MRPLVPLLLLALAFPAAAAAQAKADGLPLGGGDAGPAGVAGAGTRYVALAADASTTVVAQTDPGTGKVLRHRTVGRYTIPAVALDGSASGLSHDGRTLVLIRPRNTFPQARTRMLVLDTDRLRTRARLELAGDFSFDAISPDGGTLFLVQYTSRRDPTRYAVRAYDLAARRLVPGAIIDRRQPDEDMSGYPITRSESPDGRWHYTLYDGVGHPFIHALDTVGRTAYCIDLHGIEGMAQELLYTLRLRADGRRIDLLEQGRAIWTVDARTLKVSKPVARPAPVTEEDGGVPLAPAIAGGAGLLALLTSRARRRRARRRPPAAPAPSPPHVP